MKEYNLITGKSEIVLKDFPENHFDSCVTDPPYGISFMGKKWDYKVPSVDQWVEIYRVMKPGAYLICFGGPRTYHRVVCNIEDAGFEIRDQISWVFASGFPKSSNQKGEWEGWGSALKPAHEPILIARKPLSGTIPENLEKFGTGAINIDGCRIDGEPWTFGTQTDIKGGNYGTNRPSNGNVFNKNVTGGEKGRWPANLIHDGSDEVLALFPESKGQQGNVTGKEQSHTGDENTNCYGEYDRIPFEKRDDSGSAARFFYCAKTSRSDRNEGCENFISKPLLWSSGTQNPGSFQSEGTDKSSPNSHPTVKPTSLMRYLCRLVTPPGGHILDPFGGSGSTGKGDIYENFNVTLIDSDEQWLPIQQARCEYALRNRSTQFDLF